MKIETILFDLDDTLLNGKKSARIYARKFADSYKDNLNYYVSDEQIEDILQLKGKNFMSRERLFITLYQNYPWIVKPTLPEILEFWAENYPKSSVLYDGLDEILQTIIEKGIKIAVVTNGPSAFQNAKIDQLGLRKYVKEFIISEEVGFKKPEPEIYQIAMKKLMAKTQTTLFVGDNPNTDILGAFRLGLKTAWMANDYIWEEKSFEPDYTLNSVYQLQKII